MTILAMADCDDFEWLGPTQAADVVVGLGDLADSLLLSAARAHGTATILAVKGNHDDTAPFHSPILNAHLIVHSIGGLRFGGFAGSWRYKPRGHHLFDQHEVTAALPAFPAVDVFLAHNSPARVHERDEDTHQGFTAFSTYLEQKRPALLLHGHQHLSRETRLFETTVIGVYGHRYVTVAE